MARKSNVGTFKASETADTAAVTAKNHVQLSFRIDSELHEKLKRAAEQNRTTINTEMKWRIDRTFEEDQTRELGELVQDLKITWHRYAERLLEITGVDEILSALVDRNYGKAEAFAAEILKTRAAMARERSEQANRDAAAIERGRRQHLQSEAASTLPRSE